MRLGSADLCRSFVRAVLGLAVAGLVASGCGSSQITAPKSTTVSCQTVESCRQAISKVADQPVLLPGAAELHFVSGQVPAPGVNLGGLYGQLTYLDSAAGWEVNYLVWTGQPGPGGISPSGCYKLSSFTSPGGRSGCYQDQAIRWNQLYTKFAHDGLIYVMNARDPRPPSPATATEDQQWATALIDSYQ